MLAESRALIHQPAEQIAWQVQENGYQIAGLCSNYGGIRQRWLLVYSEQAFQREQKTLEKRLAKEEAALIQQLWHLSHERFACQVDAEKALDQLRRKQTFFTLVSETVPIEKHVRRGRPKADEAKQTVGYQIKASASRNEAAIARTLQAKGRFILATNDLDTARYPDTQLLADYKAQQTVERGFRFLKNPEFMADTLFLKSPKRIAALMMIMTLCLLVYNVAQHRLRQALRDSQQTVPNQLGKPIDTPTLRWIFQLMEGIALVNLFDSANNLFQQIVSNLSELRIKIIRLFGGAACLIYKISG